MKGNKMDWKHTIKIRQYLTEDSSKKAQIAAANGITKEIQKLPVNSLEGELICNELREAAVTGNLRWFKHSLNELWDWLDENKIWVDW